MHVQNLLLTHGKFQTCGYIIGLWFADLSGEVCITCLTCTYCILYFTNEFYRQPCLNYLYLFAIGQSFSGEKNWITPSTPCMKTALFLLFVCCRGVLFDSSLQSETAALPNRQNFSPQDLDSQGTSYLKNLLFLHHLNNFLELISNWSSKYQ